MFTENWKHFRNTRRHNATRRIRRILSLKNFLLKAKDKTKESKDKAAFIKASRELQIIANLN